MIIRGKVREGKKRGKTLGFPTANIRLRKRVPEGVYISKTAVNGTWYNSITFIGEAKTFSEHIYQAESYLLNFNESLYGNWISIKLLKKIRGNKRFSSIGALVSHMKKDKQNAVAYFSTTRLWGQTLGTTDFGDGPEIDCWDSPN